MGTSMTEASEAAGTTRAQANGRVFRWAFAYDLLLHIIWRGSERIYREKTVELAGIRTGESVLDVGCGTGTLAIAAKRRVGPAGRVFGLDASREMVSRARKKAAIAGKRHSTRCSARRSFIAFQIARAIFISAKWSAFSNRTAGCY